MNLTKIIEQVCSISIDAGKEILKVYEIMDDIGVEYKADNSPLTKADQAANKKICEGLEALDPACSRGGLCTRDSGAFLGH
jgi:3'(2'), 5'-bisphosphate nucleotidase